MKLKQDPTIYILPYSKCVVYDALKIGSHSSCVTGVITRRCTFMISKIKFRKASHMNSYM